MTWQPDYQPFWCEENVWRLCADPGVRGGERRVAFISNTARCCRFFRQRAARSGEPVFWDYHVVLLARDAGAWLVYDLDTTAGFPVPARGWIDASFGDPRRVPAAFAPIFRVMDAEEYRATFASDRSHMRDRNGAWIAPPPPWPPIRGDAPSTLPRMWSMEGGIGEVLDLPRFEERFAGYAPVS